MSFIKKYAMGKGAILGPFVHHQHGAKNQHDFHDRTDPPRQLGRFSQSEYLLGSAKTPETPKTTTRAKMATFILISLQKRK